MENSRLYVFIEYLPVSHSARGLQALQQLDLSTSPRCIHQVLGATSRYIF
jgi:hypothetical protein